MKDYPLSEAPENRIILATHDIDMSGAKIRRADWAVVIKGKLCPIGKGTFDFSPSRWMEVNPGRMPPSSGLDISNG